MSGIQTMYPPGSVLHCFEVLHSYPVALSVYMRWLSLLQDIVDSSYPVMVWMYGGGYQAGASIQYPGHFLAAQGVVVVVPNYRLNIFGKYLLILKHFCTYRYFDLQLYNLA